GMGIRIEVKTPRINVDYELEKAYNALVSGNTEAASSIYRNVLENDANNKNALFGLATIYHRAGQLEKARPLYAQLLTVDPNNRDGLNNFLVLLADEAPEDALTHLERLREANPGFSPIPAQMAVIYTKLGQTDKAIENMTKAIELAPENIAYRYNFAIMLDKQKKYDEAAVLYRQILQAYQRGDKIPGNIQQIQQRLTFISSNRN
ncbi:MAG: tetratricopeptide repeat protein, partial [Rickettsiales bacterium]|nr:tetratricopeptide repeat protein [Rickettsiales bacterium]